MNSIKKLLGYIENAIEYLSMATLVIMVILIFTQVITRYIFHFVLTWSEETSIILMIWFGFISVAIGVKRGIHLNISALVNLFPKSLQKIIYILDEVAVLVFGIIAVTCGIDLTKATLDSTLPATQLPSAVIYAVLPVSGVMLSIYALVRIVDILQTNKNELGGKS